MTRHRSVIHRSITLRSVSHRATGVARGPRLVRLARASALSWRQQRLMCAGGRARTRSNATTGTGHVGKLRTTFCSNPKARKDPRARERDQTLKSPSNNCAPRRTSASLDRRLICTLRSPGRRPRCVAQTVKGPSVTSRAISMQPRGSRPMTDKSCNHEPIEGLRVSRRLPKRPAPRANWLPSIARMAVAFSKHSISVPALSSVTSCRAIRSTSSSTNTSAIRCGSWWPSLPTQSWTL